MRHLKGSGLQAQDSIPKRATRTGRGAGFDYTYKTVNCGALVRAKLLHTFVKHMLALLAS